MESANRTIEGADSPRRYSFEGRKESADGLIPDAEKARIVKAFLEKKGVVTVEKATLEEDKQGVDFWAIRADSSRLAVDVKVKAKDWGDIVLELWSVLERQVPGWTIRPDSRTEYVVFVFADTRRAFYVEFQTLRAVTLLNWAEWCRRFRPRENRTTDYGGYTSVWLPVPIPVIEEAVRAFLNRDASGNSLS